MTTSPSPHIPLPPSPTLPPPLLFKCVQAVTFVDPHLARFFFIPASPPLGLAQNHTGFSLVTDSGRYSKGCIYVLELSIPLIRPSQLVEDPNHLEEVSHG